MITVLMLCIDETKTDYKLYIKRFSKDARMSHQP